MVGGIVLLSVPPMRKHRLFTFVLTDFCVTLQYNQIVNNGRT